MEVRQRMKFTGTNSSIGLIVLILCAHRESDGWHDKNSFSKTTCSLPTWWLWRGGCTRSHSEHGRETPQR
jgi:hypothetical protein